MFNWKTFERRKSRTFDFHCSNEFSKENSPTLNKRSTDFPRNESNSSDTSVQRARGELKILAEERSRLEEKRTAQLNDFDKSKNETRILIEVRRKEKETFNFRFFFISESKETFELGRTTRTFEIVDRKFWIRNEIYRISIRNLQSRLFDKTERFTTVETFTTSKSLRHDHLSTTTFDSRWISW